MKKKLEEFVAENVIEKVIAALQANYDSLPLGKPRTAVMQLLVPYIMQNIERGESVRNIVSIINNLCYIARKEEIEAIIAAHTKDTKQDSTRRKRRSKPSEQNDTENGNSVQNALSGSDKDMSGDVNGSIGEDLEPAGDINGDQKDHHKDGIVGSDGYEMDIHPHDPEPKEDTAGASQGQLGPEQVPKNDGSFIVEDDIEDL